MGCCHLQTECVRVLAEERERHPSVCLSSGPLGSCQPPSAPTCAFIRLLISHSVTSARLQMWATEGSQQSSRVQCFSEDVKDNTAPQNGLQTNAVIALVRITHTVITTQLQLISLHTSKVLIRCSYDNQLVAEWFCLKGGDLSWLCVIGRLYYLTTC